MDDLPETPAPGPEEPPAGDAGVEAAAEEPRVEVPHERLSRGFFVALSVAVPLSLGGYLFVDRHFDRRAHPSPAPVPTLRSFMPGSVSGTAESVSGTAESVSGTAASVSGTAQSVSGTAGSVSGTAQTVSWTARPSVVARTAR